MAKRSIIVKRRLTKKEEARLYELEYHAMAEHLEFDEGFVVEDYLKRKEAGEYTNLRKKLEPDYAGNGEYECDKDE